MMNKFPTEIPISIFSKKGEQVRAAYLPSKTSGHTSNVTNVNILGQRKFLLGNVNF